MTSARQWAAVVLVSFSVGHAWAQDDIVNYLAYSPVLSSSGQPTAEQLGALPAAGFERVIYLALTDDDTAVAHEDSLVRKAGMRFFHLPVIWDEPTVADFETFHALMALRPDMPTLVHCQINLRASSFAFLYRVIELGVPMDEAVADLNRVWSPQPHWRQFIFDVLAQHNIDPQCDLCDWQTARR